MGKPSLLCRTLFDRPHVSSWTLNIPGSVSSFLLPASQPVTQKFLHFLVNSQKYSPANASLRECAHKRWRKSAKGRVPSAPLVSQSYMAAVQHGRLKPPQPGWRSLGKAVTPPVSSTVLLRPSSHEEHQSTLAGEGEKPAHSITSPPPSPTKRVQAADPQALDASVTLCPSTLTTRLKQTKRLRFGQTTLSVQTPTHPTSTSS